MATDYISREAAIKAAFSLCRNTDYPFIDEIQNAIEEIPAADVVEVVRCGECIFRTSGYPSCQGRPKDWFCANGYGRNK